MGKGTRILAALVIGTLCAAVSVGAEEAGKEAGMAQTVQDGSTVKIDYTLTVDGQQVDSSEGREPLSYVQGQGQIIPGLEHALAGMHVGDTKDVTVESAEGYGAVDPEAVVELPKTQLPDNLTPQVGMMLRGTGPDGQPFRAFCVLPQKRMQPPLTSSMKLP